MLSSVIHLAWSSLGHSRLTTVFLIGAVAAGVGFQIPNTANLDGYRAELIKHSVTTGFGHVRLRPHSSAHIADSAALAGRLRADPRVRDTSVVLSFPGALGRAQYMGGAAIFGIDMTRRHLPFSLKAGGLVTPGDARGVVVGSTLAARLDLQVGDEVEVHAIFEAGDDSLSDDDLLSDDDDDDSDSDSDGVYTMTIRGLAIGTYSAARSLFVDYRFAERESGHVDSASMLLVYLHRQSDTERVAADVRARESEVKVTTWLQDDTFIRSAIQSSAVIGGVSEAMVVFAVAIPVLALMYIQIIQRRRDIGLLAALGFSPFSVFGIFLLQTLFIGLLGIAIGCSLGYGLIKYFQANVVFEFEQFVLRPLLSWQGLLRPALVVLAVTVAAGVYPAWRAARIDPARVLQDVD